ncbi:MAG: ribonuclease HII [Thermoplasmatota archaeon]
MICGVDEAGRGPVIGPMVVAGVLVEKDDFLKKIDVRDSKMLSPGKRKTLSKKIKENTTYTIRVILAEEIDNLRDEMSLNEIEAGIFASIIDELCDEVTTVYVDAASTDEEDFARMINERLDKDLDIISRHAADESFPVVSAASILAKVKRDEEIERISEDLDQEIGSGYPSDIRTRDFLKRWVKEHGSLPPYTRRSWYTAKNVLEKSKTKRLDEF